LLQLINAPFYWEKTPHRGGEMPESTP